MIKNKVLNLFDKLIPFLLYIALVYISTIKNGKNFMSILNDDSNFINVFVIFELIIFIYIWVKIRGHDNLFFIIRRKNKITIMLDTTLKLVIFTFLLLDGLYTLFYHLDKIMYHTIIDYRDLLNYKILLFLICGFIFETFKSNIKIPIILMLYLLLYKNIIPIIFVLDLLIIIVVIYSYRLFDCDLDV